MRISDWSADVCSSDRRPASFCGIHCEEGAIAPDAERIVIFIKRDICKLIIYRPYDERGQAGTHLDIGMHAMTAVLEPDGMSAVRCGQVAGVQAESKTAVRPRTLALDLDGQEGRVPHIDVQLFGRRHEHMAARSEEHTSELQSLMRISYAVFCLKNKQ